MFRLKFVTLFFILISYSAHAERWVLSAYSAYHQNKRIWITINDDKIDQISTKETKDTNIKIVESDDFVFPGLIDLHNHTQYNVLPLWDKAQGQYDNRFEWRKDPKYKAYVSQAMKVFRSNGRPDMKNNIIWAELKSLAGATTALLGSGGNAYHGDHFGVMNLELIGQEDQNVSIDLSTDIVSDRFYAEIYLPYMEDIFARGQGYDRAYANYLEQSGIQSWFDNFISAESIFDYLSLLFAGNIPEDIDSVDRDNIESIIDVLLNQKLEVKVWDKETAKRDIIEFLFGGSNNQSPLDLEKDLELAAKFFALEGNFLYHYSIRDFVYEFQNKRNDFIASTHEEDSHHSLVVHLSEGKASDEFTSKEFAIADQLGFVDQGLVIIHGMGMTKKQLKQSKKRGLSLVWSPYSNLLLYGETHQMQDVMASKINLVLAPDWSVTGSKNLLDEMKLAKEYLQKNHIDISSKELVDMVTINAAKAIKATHLMGKIAKGTLANLVLVSRQHAQDGYLSLVEANQKDVHAVFIKGRLAYGNRSHVTKAKQLYPELKFSAVPTDKALCGFTYYAAKGNLTASFQAIERDLNQKLAQFRGDEAPLKADPIFRCADPDYDLRTKNFLP